MNNDFISVHNFGIKFGNKTIIKDLSFSIKSGEIFGLLGSNGSGKTTTIRALLGLYPHTTGDLLINGRSYRPGSDITVGYLPEERGLYRKETVFDTMLYFAQLKKLKNPKSWIKKYLKRVQMSEHLHQKIEKLSSGQQQKIQLGITIMDQPKLLILDEPTKGFDPVNRKLLMDIIDELHLQSTTIILITHYMDEVERLCDRILLLKDGHAAAYGNIDTIKTQFGQKSLDQIFVEIYGAKS